MGLNYSVIDIDIRANFWDFVHTSENNGCGKAEIVIRPHPTDNAVFSGKKDSWLLASVPITARVLEHREIMLSSLHIDYNIVIAPSSHSGRLWFQFSSDVVRNIVDFIRDALEALLTKHREKLFQTLERELPVLLDNLERRYLELAAFLKFILPDFDSVAFLRPVAHVRDSFDRARQNFSLENLKVLLDLCLLERNSVLGEANARIYPCSLSDRKTLAQKMGPHEKSFMQMVYLTKCILSSCGSSYYNYTPMLKPSDLLSHIGNTFGYIDAKKSDEAKDAIKGYKMYFINGFQTVIKNQRVVERNPVTLGLQGAKSELSVHSAALLRGQQQSRSEGAPFGPSAFFQGAPSTSTSAPGSESGAAPQI